MSAEEYQEIIRGITAGLKGDFQEDCKYLLDKMKEYKDHEYGTEIVRACGRLLQDLAPDDMKKDLIETMHQEVHNYFLGLQTVAEEARFNIYKKNWPKALELIESVVDNLENEFLTFDDDKVSEYHFFHNILEEIIYKELFKPTKEVRAIPEDYAEIYYLYGAILFELKRYDEAEAALKKALRINPVRTDIISELTEVYKIKKEWDEYLILSRRMLDCSYTSESVAKALRNLGYYYSEQREFDTAVAVYLFSNQFEQSYLVNSELMYIQQQTGKQIVPPSQEEMRQIFSMHDIPMGANKDVLGIAYTLAVEAEKQDIKDAARFFYNVVFDLTGDEEIRKRIEKFEN